MNRIFDALNRADEARMTELRAQTAEIVQCENPGEPSLKSPSRDGRATSPVESQAMGAAERTPDDAVYALAPGREENDGAGIEAIIHRAPSTLTEQSRKRLQSALASAIEDLVNAECRRASEHEL